MTVKIEAINCGNCGAPLEVPETVQFVTCNHCKTSLAVKRMESVTLTEKLEKTHERLDQTERRLAEMVYRNEISGETRRWERHRETLMVTDKHGNKSKPSAIAGGFVLVVTVIMAFVASNILGVFAFLLVIFGFFALMFSIKKQQEYESAYRRHKQRRQEITARYTQARDNDSHSDYLQQLETTPQFEDFLRNLEEN